MADGAGTVAQAQSFTPSPATTRQFRDALGSFATGVTLITIKTDAGPMGFAANSFASVSLDPPLVLWSLARSSRRAPLYLAAQHYAIHVLPFGARDLLARFMTGGLGFEGLDYTHNPDGVPLLDMALARFECRQHAVHDGGDHAVIIGRVLRGSYQSGAPLLFHSGAYGGFAPQG